jgi:tetratricopeptide (TPR) repeat protein
LGCDKIKELTHLGLLDERDGHFGFHDLASARQISKLLTDGIRLLEIIRSVSEIRKWLPAAGLANVWLRHGPSHALEVEQPGGRTDKHGQFVLAVDHSHHDTDDLFQQAQSAEEGGDFAEAERLYRILVKSDSTDASAPFNLGNMLRARSRNVEAEAALRTATRVDPNFAEA